MLDIGPIATIRLAFLAVAACLAFLSSVSVSVSSLYSFLFCQLPSNRQFSSYHLHCLTLTLILRHCHRINSSISPSLCFPLACQFYFYFLLYVSREYPAMSKLQSPKVSPYWNYSCHPPLYFQII